PELLRHGDLNALDVVAVPERLQERIRKAEVDNVVHRPLAEVMVDAKNRRLGESREQDAVQFPRRCQIRAERLFDYYSTVLRTARFPERLDHRFEEHRRNGQIVRRPLRGAKGLADRLERGAVVVVSVDVAQQSGEFSEGLLVNAAMLLHTVPRAIPKLIDAPA